MKKNVKKEFWVSSDLSEVPSVSVKVLSFLEPLALDDKRLFDIRLSLEEALINAIKHGHGLRDELKVRLEVQFNDEQVMLAVEDQGKGFDLQCLPNCTEEHNLMKHSGRGVHLIHQLMDEVKYNSKGNRVVMVKFLHKK